MDLVGFFDLVIALVGTIQSRPKVRVLSFLPTTGFANVTDSSLNTLRIDEI